MNDEQMLRYSRQIMLPQIDVTGQERLQAANVLIIGIGGLGSPAAMYLAAAGVGRLTLVDDDAVDLSNLQRQIAHTTDRIGWNKAVSGEKCAHSLNPDCRIIAVDRRLEGDSLEAVAAAADVVLDCSDNFATRFSINAACVAARKPLVSGAATRWEGQLSVFSGRPEDPCYRCLYAAGEEPGDSCAESGVVAPLVGIVGAAQAVEAIKLITGAGRPLIGRLLVIDVLDMQWRTLKLVKDPACPVCHPAASQHP